MLREISPTMISNIPCSSLVSLALFYESFLQKQNKRIKKGGVCVLYVGDWQ